MTEENEDLLIESVKKLANAVMVQGQAIAQLQARIGYLERVIRQYEPEALLDAFNRPYEG